MSLILNIGNLVKDENSKDKDNVKNKNILTLASKESDLDDEKVQSKLAKIKAKLMSGKRLSRKEMEFLRQYDNELYMLALKMERLRKTVENQLKSCKSKEEVSIVITRFLSGLNKNDPEFQIKANTINEAAKEFMKTDRYNNLPETTQEAKKQKDNDKDTFTLSKDLKKENEPWIEINEFSYQEMYE
ncbi:hypothetical protein [Acetitomaculum ruminis]|nr:hypothetical protein [Acetitomaculum ruminis]